MNFSIPKIEYDSLYDFYISTNGKNWYWNKNNNELYGIHWNFSLSINSPCKDHWRGLKCICDKSNYPDNEKFIYAYSYNYVYQPDINNTNYSNIYNNSLITCHIEKLNLIEGHLYGTIPSSVSNFKMLKALHLNVNKLYGTIPNDICNLFNLEVLSISDNKLIGTIPKCVGNLKKLFMLDFDSNYLTGTIPSKLGELSNLNYLFLYSNLLSGTFPTELCNYPSLVYFFIHQNRLSGSIPTELSNLMSLKYFLLYENLFTGSLPNALYRLTELQYIKLDNNSFIGSISSQNIKNLKGLQYISLSNNMFTGVLPDTVVQLIHLEYFNLESNYFHSSIPYDINNLVHLKYLGLNYNLFSSSIPITLNLLPNINVILLQHNIFTGQISNLFNISLQNRLNIIDISENKLTGNLNLNVFQSQHIYSYSAGLNCFTATISSQICSSKSLSILSLDGLGASKHCNKKLLPAIGAETYMISNKVFGGLPSCMFAMSNMTTLHLSGNGIIGTLPLIITPTLKDLSLSYNELYGTIPEIIQTKTWDNLDLSHNKLSGSLSSKFAKIRFNSSVSLAVNRLSGKIPSALLNLISVNILAANVFDCTTESNSLPTNDKTYLTYSCGSNAFNVSIYIWLGLIGFFCIILLSRYILSIKISILSNNWFNEIKIWRDNILIEKTKVSNLSKVLLLLEQIESFSRVIAIISVVIFIPVYAILKSFYSTHQYQYAFTISVTFLSGSVPTGIIFMLWSLIFIYYFSWRAFKLFPLSKKHVVDVEHSENINDNLIAIGRTSKRSTISLNHNSASLKVLIMKKSKFRRYFVLGIIAIVNIIIVLLVNIGFVYVSINYNKSILITSQILLAIFKLVWNEVAIMAILYVLKTLILESAFLISSDSHNNEEMLMNSFLLLFNNILVPCLASLMVSPNCFYNVIVDPDPVSIKYSVYYCPEMPYFQITISKPNCYFDAIKTFSITYTPPFIYTYQCSSVFITSYASTYVYMFLILTVFPPLRDFILRYIYESNSSLSKSILPLLNKLISPIIEKQDDESHSNKDVSFIKREKFILKYTNTFAIILTFGVVFPPLAVVIFISTFTSTNYLNLLFGRFISKAKQYHFIDQLNRDCNALSEYFYNSSLLIIPFVSVFYAFFIFDTFGDTEGWYKALPITIIMFISPLFFYLLVNLFQHISKSMKSNNEIKAEDNIMACNSSKIEENKEKLNQSNNNQDFINTVSCNELDGNNNIFVSHNDNNSDNDDDDSSNSSAINNTSVLILNENSDNISDDSNSYHDA